MSADELMASLFDRKPHPLAEAMEEWLGDSRRFADFARANETKIRKKLRSTREVEALQDLKLELETAHLLLRERALSLVYEPPRENARNPDFAVSFTTSLTFMLEVTRLRLDESGRTLEERFIDVVCGKLRQLVPGTANVLLVGVEGKPPSEADVPGIMLRLQHRAEQHEAWLVQRYGFRDRADFFQQYYRLSALLVRPIPLSTGAAVAVWDNPQAKHPLPSKVRTALGRSHALEIRRGNGY